MDENNLSYLKKLQSGIGFGEKLNGVLEIAIARELPKFTLGISNKHRPLESDDVTAGRTDQIQYGLNYNRQRDGDAYFLNTMDVTLYKPGESIPRQQTFELDRDHRITALQAYKLLSGLSLEKDIFVKPKGAEPDAKRSEKIKAWFKLQLDVTDAYGNHPLKVLRPEYGYDLERVLEKYPIKALKNEDNLLDALQTLRNGNYWHADMKIGKVGVPVMLAANPLMKSIDVFDKSGREIRSEEIWPNAAQQKTTVIKNEAPAEGQEISLEQTASEKNTNSRGR